MPRWNMRLSAWDEKIKSIHQDLTVAFLALAGLSAEAAALEVALRAGNGAAAKQAAQRVEAVAAAAVSEIAGAVHRAKAAAS